MHIGIVGAGPAGCYAAYILAEAGIHVSVYEEHTSIGEPPHCAGIVTESIKKILEIPDSIIVNRITKARIYAPNHRCIEFNLKNPNLILDRIKFDKWLGEKAELAGAQFFFGHTFIEYKNREMTVKHIGSLIKIKTDYLIGADGPYSAVAQSLNLLKNRKFWQGVQVRIKLNNVNSVEFYPYIGTFAWIIPENASIVRIGLLAKKDAYPLLKKFIQEKAPKSKIINKQAGLVPVYDPHLQTQKGRVYLIGDAATQVKATSGGGIIQALIASQCVAQAILKKKNYEKIWRKKIALDLFLHLRMRKILDKFSDKDYNYLTYLVNQKKIRSILEKFDRDYPAQFLFRMMLKEPRFLYFIKKVL